MTDAGPARFGRCGCGGTFEQRLVEVRVTIDGTAFLHEGVQQGNCPLCGRRVYQAAMVVALERFLRSGAPPSS